MTIDKNTLDKAQAWAEDLHFQASDEACAAAEVIRDLPDEWIDTSKLRKILDRIDHSLSFSACTEHGEGFVAASRHWKEAIAALLPAPTPQVEIALGAWAMHPEHGKVLIVATKTYRDGGVLVAFPDERNATGAAYEWVPATDLSPLPDTHDDSAPDRGANYQGLLNSSPEPQPKDIPEGEVWMIRPYENADPVPSFRVHESKYGPGKRWAHYRVGGSMLGFSDDEDVTPLRRLVPAQEPRVLTTVEDYENAADGTVAHWGPTVIEKKNGSWYSTGSNAWNETDSTMSDHGPCTVLWEPEV